MTYDLTADTPEARAIRATIPELMFIEDVRIVLGLQSRSAATRAIKSAGVPYTKVGRKIVVLRRDFMAFMRRRAAGE